MDGVRVQPPACGGDKCGNEGAVPFFLSFVFLVSIVMLNLFTAVIIENFEKQYEQEEWKLTGESLQQFVDLWSEYDNGSGALQAIPCAAAAVAAAVAIAWRWAAGTRARGCCKFRRSVLEPAVNGILIRRSALLVAPFPLLPRNRFHRAAAAGVAAAARAAAAGPWPERIGARRPALCVQPGHPAAQLPRPLPQDAVRAGGALFRCAHPRGCAAARER